MVTTNAKITNNYHHDHGLNDANKTFHNNSDIHMHVAVPIGTEVSNSTAHE